MGGRWVEESYTVKGGILKFFQNKFKEGEGVRPFLDGWSLRVLKIWKIKTYVLLLMKMK